jgi:hypothetical protein
VWSRQCELTGQSVHHTTRRASKFYKRACKSYWFGRMGGLLCVSSDDRAARVMRGQTDVFAAAAFAVRLSSPRLRVCPAYRARPLALFLAGVLGRAASVA